MFIPLRSIAVPVALLGFGGAALSMGGASAIASAVTPNAHVALTSAMSSVSPNYVKIVEPFSTPGRCTSAPTTLAMTFCLENRVVRVDQTVNTLQRDRFNRAKTKTAKQVLLNDDAHWLKTRRTTCAANQTGGTIDQINDAQCLLNGSKARANKLVNAI